MDRFRMSELYIHEIEAAAGSKFETEGVQDVIHDTTSVSIPVNHPEQSPVRKHLLALKIRRDRCVREFLTILRKKDPAKAVLMEVCDGIKDRKNQFNANKDFMLRLGDTDPEFKAIFSSYDRMRKWVKAGTYTPANQPMDIRLNDEEESA